MKTATEAERTYESLLNEQESLADFIDALLACAITQRRALLRDRALRQESDCDEDAERWIDAAGSDAATMRLRLLAHEEAA